MEVPTSPPVELDLDRLRLPRALSGPLTTQETNVPRHAPGERFLKGPVPWSWLERAGLLPGRALHVGLALWLRAGMARSRTVQFRFASVASQGVGRQAARRG